MFYYSKKCMGTKDVNNHAKKGQLKLKTTLDIFNMQMLSKKNPFLKNVSDWNSFLQAAPIF